MLEIFALLILGFPPVHVSAATSSCTHETRAVLDLGSGSTKLIIGEVEKCPGREQARLMKVLDDSQSRPLPLEASKDKTGNIPEDMQKKVVATLEELKSLALKKSPNVTLAVVGTHAFRTARNLNAFRAKIEAAGFSVKALTQDEEGRAGYQAVHESPQAKACVGRDLWVWDIGGGSMQVSNDSRVLGLPMGTEGFKAELIHSLPAHEADQSCAPEGASPNPIGAENISKARKVTERKMRQLLKGKVPPNLKGACIIGLGGVHTKAVHRQILNQAAKIKSCSGTAPQTGSYTKKELNCLIDLFVNKTDCDAEIKGPYSTTNVSNLFLVAAWMELTGIDQVHTSSLGIAENLLTSSLNFRR